MNSLPNSTSINWSLKLKTSPHCLCTSSTSSLSGKSSFCCCCHPGWLWELPDHSSFYILVSLKRKVTMRLMLNVYVSQYFSLCLHSIWCNRMLSFSFSMYSDIECQRNSHRHHHHHKTFISYSYFIFQTFIYWPYWQYNILTTQIAKGRWIDVDCQLEWLVSIRRPKFNVELVAWKVDQSTIAERWKHYVESMSTSEIIFNMIYRTLNCG